MKVNECYGRDYTHERSLRSVQEDGAMLREHAMKIVLVLVGLLFSAAISPVIGGLSDPAHRTSMPIYSFLDS